MGIVCVLTYFFFKLFLFGVCYYVYSCNICYKMVIFGLFFAFVTC